MTAVHAALGGVMALLFAAAGGLGAWRWWRVEPSDGFWRLLRAAQVVMVLEAALGGVLLLIGERPSDDLHYVYGLLPLAVSFVAEQLRISSAETSAWSSRSLTRCTTAASSVSWCRIDE